MKAQKEAARLEKMYSELHTQTTLYGLNHHGNEVHQKLEEALTAIRTRYNQVMEESAVYLPNWSCFVRINKGEVEIAQSKNEKEHHGDWTPADQPEKDFLEDLKWQLGWEVEWKGYGHNLTAKVKEA